MPGADLHADGYTGGARMVIPARPAPGSAHIASALSQKATAGPLRSETRSACHFEPAGDSWEHANGETCDRREYS